MSLLMGSTQAHSSEPDGCSITASVLTLTKPRYRAEGVAQLVECLFSIPESPGSFHVNYIGKLSYSILC